MPTSVKMISSEQITDAEPLPMESGWNADIDDQITIELLEKNRLLEEFVTEHSQDDNVINVRIQQLAIAKVYIYIYIYILNVGTCPCPQQK